VLQLQKNDLLSIDDDDLEVGSFPPPQMTIDIASTDVLQITITKTSLEVFSNLAQVFCSSVPRISISQNPLKNLFFSTYEKMLSAVDICQHYSN